MRVDRENQEHLTDALTGEPIRSELVGPGTVFREVLGDATTITYGALAVLVLGTAQRQAVQGLRDHEEIFRPREDGSGPSDVELTQYGLRRLKESVELVAGIAFAPTEQDRADAAFALRELHRKVKGRLDDGSPYHAWQPDVWAHAWAGIFRGLLLAYETFRGFESSAARDETLEAFVEFGRLFGVRGIPDTWVEFDRYWDDFLDGAVVDETVQTIAGVVRNGSFRRAVRRHYERGGMVAAIKSGAAFPLFRVLRVGAVATFPEGFDDDLGMTRTWIDDLELRAHQLLWRAVPRSASSQFLPIVFEAARRLEVEPVWRTRFSRSALADARAAGVLDAGRAETLEMTAHDIG